MAEYIELGGNNRTASILIPNPSRIPVESPENIEMGGKIDNICLVIEPKYKILLRRTLYICTAFILWLFAYWIPGLKIALSYVESDIRSADYVIVRGADKNIEIVRLLREKTSNKTIKVFTYRLFKYYFEENSKSFKACQFKVENLPAREIHKQYGTGLTEAEIQDRIVFYGRNLTDVPRKSVWKLLFEEVLSPFYIFQVYSFIIWFLDAYAVYAGIIFVFSAVSIGLTLYETMQTTNKLRNMSYYEIPVVVYRRSGERRLQCTINSSEMVPGDLFLIPEGKLMPCDAILMNGTSIMNESMLTGESIPVVKNSLPHFDVNYNPKEDKQYTLYAGTKCIQTRSQNDQPCVGMVTLTGFTTVKGELVRTMLFPKPTDFKFYSDSFKFIFILAAFAFIGFLIDLPSWIDYNKANGEDSMFSMIIIKASEIVTVTVPPALPTCMQIGVSVALSRLKEKQTYCISPNKINEAGRINIMCFDKTGTLTEEGLDLLGVRPVFFDKNSERLSMARLVKDIRSLSLEITQEKRYTEIQNYIAHSAHFKEIGRFPCEIMLEIMAACHGLTRVKGELIGDPLDLKMFEATNWEIIENQTLGDTYSAIVRPKTSSQSFETVVQVGITRKFEFASKLQRMGVIVRNLGTENFKMHVKGSPEKIRELCLPSTIPENFHSTLAKYTENGYRVLACATKALDMNYSEVMSSKREDLESSFTFIGFLIMENKLKPVTTDMIHLLQSAGVKPIMVTGDNVLTAISVARQCGIVSSKQKIFLGEMVEKKNSQDKSRVIWRDFEFSSNILNEEMEPELNYNTPSKPVRTLSSGDINQKHEYKDEDGHVLNSQNQDENDNEIEYGVMDLDPPFFDKDDNDDYCIAVDGKTFSKILHEVEVKKCSKHAFVLRKLLKKCLVFARMQPDEKALMIKHMMSIKKNIVGMCGDGANDCGALKTANVGVSLSEAEASIAAPFTSKIQDISCIPRLLREGKAALATSFQCFKYMALYSIIQFTSVTILYLYEIDLTNWHYYHIDVLLILPLSATMAMSETHPTLNKFKPTGRLISVAILTSVIGQAFIQIFFQIFTYNQMLRQDFYDPADCVDDFDSGNACAENTTIYLISIYQYTAVALAFIIGRPFRKSFYTNRWFTWSFIFLMFCNILVTLNFFQWTFLYDTDSWNAETKVPMHWRVHILILAFINSAITLFWDRVFVKYIALRWKDYRDHKEKVKESEENRYRPPEFAKLA